MEGEGGREELREGHAGERRDGLATVRILGSSSRRPLRRHGGRAVLERDAINAERCRASLNGGASHHGDTAFPGRDEGGIRRLESSISDERRLPDVDEDPFVVCTQTERQARLAVDD